MGILKPRQPYSRSSQSMDPVQHRHIRGLHARATPNHPLARPRVLSPVPDSEPLPRWISVAGLEFGVQSPGFCNDFPGKLGRNFFLNSRNTFERLSEAGFTTFRIPFRWERLQPTLGGPLDPDGVQHLRLQMNLAQRVGGSVLFDLHNYGRYTRHVDGEPIACGLDEEFDGQVLVGPDHLADFWSRMAHAFSGQPGVIGYGLMNEPHDLPDKAWVRASRAAAAAIRSEGDKTRLYVAGERWSSSPHWDLVNPSSPWIEDPENLVTYEAHCYLDQNGSGEYHKTFEEELEYDPSLGTRAVERLEPFLKWLEDNNADGLLGEFAVPVDDHRWTALLAPMLQALDRAGVQTAWWAAGEHWGKYTLSLQPGKDPNRVPPAEVELFGAFGRD